MINIESDIFDVVAGRLRTSFPGIYVSGEYVDTPAKFPAVTIVETSNTVYQRMRTTNIENAVTVLYEVNVYTNQVGYKKSQAKSIISVIDEEFSRLGFTRTMMNPIANLSDATIYRIVARYTAVVDAGLMIYQS